MRYGDNDRVQQFAHTQLKCATAPVWPHKWTVHVGSTGRCSSRKSSLRPSTARSGGWKWPRKSPKQGHRSQPANLASLLGGDVVTLDRLDSVSPDVIALFRRMGFKPSSSGKLFDDYLGGGAGAQPMIVGYENQLIEWVLQDAERWKRVEANAPAKPVILYPRPTAFSAHPFISLAKDADEVIPALLDESVQELAWQDHGFRGPLGSIGKSSNPMLESRLIAKVDAVLPMPEAPAMLALLDKLAA